LPIETFWLDDDETIICQRLIPPLSIKNFKDAYERTQSMDSDFVIVDALEVHDLPRGLLSAQQPMTAPLKTSERVVVTAGATEQFRLFASTFFRVAGYGTIEFVKTMEEAEELIRQNQAERAS